ncbi:HD-domain/PDEase-like protein, partial [Caulochytrium protostelioides]
LETVRRFFRGDLANLGIAFSVWDWTRDEIHGLLLALFLRLGLVNTGLSLYKLYEFNQAVDRGYHDNPYHNFLHGVDVTYFLFHFLEEAEGAHGTCFDSRELAALLIAALAHDIGHPGKNNLFQINAKTPFFTMYGSKSVLERHSAVVCLDLLHAYGVLDTLDFPIGPTDTAENTPWIRALIEESILNTDMCFHYTLLEKIVAMTDKKFAADDEPISPTSLGTIQYAQTHDNTTVGSSAGANAGTRVRGVPRITRPRASTCCGRRAMPQATARAAPRRRAP